MVKAELRLRLLRGPLCMNADENCRRGRVRRSVSFCDAAHSEWTTRESAGGALVPFAAVSHTGKDEQRKAKSATFSPSCRVHRPSSPASTMASSYDRAITVFSPGQECKRGTGAERRRAEQRRAESLLALPSLRSEQRFWMRVCMLHLCDRYVC